MSNKSTSAPSPTQPKIVQRMMFRYALGLLALAAIVALYQALRTCGQDIDLPGHVDTVGMIAAVQLGDKGSQLVVIDRDFKVRPTPEYKDVVTERDAVWRPDGNRLLFVANREDPSFNLYRWNLGSDKIEKRSLGSRSKSYPAFGSPNSEDPNGSALIIAGGFVLEWNAKTGETKQILPPVPKNVGGTQDEGQKSQIEVIYQKLGTSFRSARWTWDRRYVVAVMKREDGSETLIIQELGSITPVPIAVGRRIDFDVSPDTDKVFYTVLDFQWIDPTQAPKEFIKNGRVTTPLKHGIFMFDVSQPPEKQNVNIYPSMKDSVAFHRPALSPDGTTLALVGGEYKGEGDVDPKGVLILPAEPGGGQVMKAVFSGPVFEPSWGPDNDTIAFIQLINGHRAICTVRSDGSGFKNITGESGSFAWPKISPQK